MRLPALVTMYPAIFYPFWSLTVFTRNVCNAWNDATGSLGSDWHICPHPRICVYIDGSGTLSPQQLPQRFRRFQKKLMPKVSVPTV